MFYHGLLNENDIDHRVGTSAAFDQRQSSLVASEGTFQEL
jgi:hypothetical protein